MKIIITGGAGFIGSRLVDVLMRQGHRVTVIGNLSSGKMETNIKLKLISLKKHGKMRNMHD